MGVIYNTITHLVLRTRQIEHMLINVNKSLRGRKMLENYIKCNCSVNRGRRVYENSLMTYLACLQQNAKKTTQRCSLLHHQWITQNDVYHKSNDVVNVPVYSRFKQDYISFILQTTFG